MQYKLNFGRANMDSICFIPPPTYYPLPINPYLYPMQQFQNNFFYIVYTSSGGDDSRQISIKPKKKNVFMEESKHNEESSQYDGSSEFQNRKRGRFQINEISFHKNLIDQQFQINIPLKKKDSLYKKKNTESNIINQALSFLNTERSFSLLFKLLQKDDQKVRWFYRMMVAIKKVNKKYTNRKYLKRLLEFAERSEFHRAYLKEKKIFMTLQQVRAVLRKLIYYFIRNYSYLSLMTSSKIYKQTLIQHFWRKKEIQKFLFECQDFEKISIQ